MEKGVINLSTMPAVQSLSDNTDVSKTSYEARGGGGSSPSLRTKYHEDEEFRKWLRSQCPGISQYLNHIPPYLEKLIHSSWDQRVRMLVAAIDPAKPQCIRQKNRKYAKRASAILRKRYPLFLLYVAIGEMCYICREKTDFSAITLDHVFPKSLGYTISRNSMPCCESCNTEKAERLPTTEEIQLACEAHEAIGKQFDPRLPHEHGFGEYLKPFKDFGLRSFS